MADNSMTFSNTLVQLDGEDFLRELTEFTLNLIMKSDVQRGADRNCYRDRQYNCRPSTLALRGIAYSAGA